jgi:hypothetical protein
MRSYLRIPDIGVVSWTQLKIDNKVVGEGTVPLTRLTGEPGMQWKGDLPLLGTQARARIRLQAFGLRERRPVRCSP